MKKFNLVIVLSIFLSFNLPAQSVKQTNSDQKIRDLYSDTWVATDALGRIMPSFNEVGAVKTDQRRIVGIFYVTWHNNEKTKQKSPYLADVTKILAKDPSARMQTDNPLWSERSFHWGEPEVGYFLSKDEYVIRKDMSMLADAGVDMLIMDVTNAVRYWNEWEVTFKVMQKMKAEGNRVPQFCFWAYNGPVITVVQELFDRVYKAEEYKDLWFYWDGKPLLLYNDTPTVTANGKGVKNPNPYFDPDAKTNVKNPHYGNPDYSEEFYTDYNKEVKSFFTLRNMWWGYYQWAGKRFVGTEDNWSFGYDLGNEKVKAMDPLNLVSLHNGKREEAAVTPAQHPSGFIGKSWTREHGEPTLNQYDMPDSAYVAWLGKTVKNPEGYGIYFQDRWNEALSANPQFLYINDWNEWTAGKQKPKNETSTFNFMGREKNPFYFVDQYNAEFNRSIQPMKDGYTDNYYMQMAQNIRKYKGIRPVPESKEMSNITIDGNFKDWDAVTTEYRDTKGDVYHRDYAGYGSLHYIDSLGRNDILTCKVAVDENNVYFYVKTDKALSPHTDKNWMYLLIDTDHNSSTGWFGYDAVVNKKVLDEKSTTLQCYSKENIWEQKSIINYKYAGNELEMSIPRNLLGLEGNSLTFDFKWCDNPEDLKDPISLCKSGDTAPNRRFNYRFVWNK